MGSQIQDFFSTQCFVPNPNLGQEIIIGELILDSVLNQHLKFFLDDDSKIRFRLSFVLGRKSKIFSGRSLGPTKGLRVFVGK